MLEILTHDAISARHGFFTRKGGASSGIFAGLNCGLGSTDQRSSVEINRTRVAEAMGLAPLDLSTLHQVHSADVITLSAARHDRPVADGMVTRTPGVLLGILTADCQPVLFHDPKAGVIGAAHAGWRGAKAGILENMLDAMERLGARRADTCAVIGPTISQTAYEVGPEFFEAFCADDPESAQFFTLGDGDRLRFDLPRYGMTRLCAAGIGSAHWTGHCTYSDASRFFSFRRTTHAKEVDYGRLISTIRL